MTTAEQVKYALEVAGELKSQGQDVRANSLLAAADALDQLEEMEARAVAAETALVSIANEWDDDDTPQIPMKNPPPPLKQPKARELMRKAGERDALAAYAFVIDTALLSAYGRLRVILGDVKGGVMPYADFIEAEIRDAAEALKLTFPTAAKQVEEWKSDSELLGKLKSVAQKHQEDSDLLHWLMEPTYDTGIRVGHLLHRWDCEGIFLDYCRAQFAEKDGK